MSNKTVVILDHNGGRLGNQLWNFAHIYAYCLERGYACRNICFYSYERFFSTISIHPVVDPIWKLLPGRAKRKIHALITKKITSNKDNPILHADKMDGDQAVRCYLPPSPNTNNDQKSILNSFEESSAKHLYCVGWAFRNPIGISKYHSQITSYLRPVERVAKPTTEEITKLRLRFHSIIGVHIRQGDYQTYAGGKFYFSQAEVRSHLDAYLRANKKDPLTTLFYICSDGTIDKNIFEGIQYIVGSHGAVGDMHALTLTDRIIASDSTLSGYAAWYGNIPITLFTRDMKSDTDWQTFEVSKVFDYNYGSYNLQP